MIEAVFIMGGLGLVVGAGLAAAAKIFYVYVDPMILAVEDVLPGANCGGCGLPGCSANAEAIVAGKAAPNSCVAAGPEVAEAIAKIMGVTVEAKEPDIALPGCTYSVADADTKYLYDGLSDCKAAVLLSGGMKVCYIGCIGLGSCVRACPFDAIIMGPKGLPVVDEERCTGCGTCERVCPKHIIKLSSVTRRILREYTTQDCTTPCQRACPAGINISEYIRQIQLKDYHKSVQVIKERNPFPTVIGRICPRPCEIECRRKYVDEPVAINFLKRFAADFEKENGARILPYKAPDTDRKIAVIGGGVEGLSVSYFAARLGHAPTVFEAASKPGGLLRSAIAKYRLPHEILDWDIDGILEMGVKIETEKALGKDFTVDSLFAQGFEAVFLASGGWDSRLSRNLGSEIEKPIPDTFLMLDLIKAGTENKNKIACGAETVIAGGGKLAFDAAKICKKLGAEKITILFRERQDNISVDNSDIKKYAKEGIHAVFCSGINRIFGKGNRLVELEYVNPDTLKKNIIPAKTLIISSGRFPGLIFTKSKTEADVSDAADQSIDTSMNTPIDWQGIEPYKTPDSAGTVGLFAKGDEITDYSAAVKAIGAGRRAAASIHQAMYGILASLPDNVITPQSIIQNVVNIENVKSVARQIMPLRDIKNPDESKELEKGYDEKTALAEADRCLQCGLICYEQSKDNINEQLTG